MRKLGMKDLLVIVLGAFINLFVWHDRNPVGVAFFCAAYALIPGKMLLAMAALFGMAYALPMTSFIRYTGLITTVMAMAAVLKKWRPAGLTPVVMCGLMVLTMVTAGVGYGWLTGRLAAAYVGHTAGIGMGTGSGICVLLAVCRHDRLDEGLASCRKEECR
ncbi:MAG: hypothetical protein ACLR5Q_08395 [Coprococcus sp.]